MRITYALLSLFWCLIGSDLSHAQLSDCEPAFSTTLLEVNNIRARIGTPNSFFRKGGDAGFEVPKGSGINSIYAHSDWIGGKTSDGQIHLSAGTYNVGGGSDFVSGPLSNDGLANTNAEVCETYAELYSASRLDAIVHYEYYDRLALVQNGGDPAILTQAPYEQGYNPPEYFYSWPAHNENADYDYHLAPFYDRNQDGVYDPDAGDYPGFNLNGLSDCQTPSSINAGSLQGHEAVWQVYNDSGLHTQTGGTPLGIEVHCTSFAFSTCDIMDNTIFQQKRIINRSSNTYYDTYIGQWTDTDLGCPEDDFVGCDVTRGLAYSYNGDPIDADCASISGYGNNPPVISFQFLAGPYQDEDGMDNPLVNNVDEALSQNGIVYQGQGIYYGDGIVDNERMKLNRFTYYRRNGGIGIYNDDEPNLDSEYYQYLSGLWKNNDPVTYGGSGNDGDIPAQFIFPGSSDPLGISTEGEVVNDIWSEESEGHEAGDRRLLAITGGFTFEPGEVQEIVTAFNWTKGNGSVSQTLTAMRINSDILQNQFEYCFQLVDQLPVANSFTYQQSGNDVTFSLPFYYNYNANWDFGDGSSSDGLIVGHEYTSEGTFEVCTTVYNCSGPSEICESVTISASDLEEISSDELILIYPNPVQNELYVHSSRIGTELRGVIIYNTAGKLILKKRWEEDIESISLPLELAPGIYTIKAVYADGLEYSTSFLKLDG